MKRQLISLVGAAWIGLTMMSTGGHAAGSAQCRPVNLGDDCVIYDNAFCSHHDLAAVEKTPDDLNGSCARHCDLEGTDFSAVVEIRDANWSGAVLDGAILAGVVMTGSVLDEATVDGADFSGADLSGASLMKIVASPSTVFEGVKLNQARLDSATLAGVALRSAELRAASLRGADLSGASFDGADLREADLRDSLTDSDTDFSRAVLCNTLMPDGTVNNDGCR